MTTWLPQSTKADIKLGPFVDDTDGATAETGLTITQPDVQLSKNGAAFAQKNQAQTLTHDADGWYTASLGVTDTNTLGSLVVQVAESGALPVFKEFQVVPSNVYSHIISGSSLVSKLDTATGQGAAIIATQATHSNQLSTATTGINDAQNKSATATRGVNTIESDVATVDTVVDGLRTSMDFATERIDYLATGGGPAAGSGGGGATATEIANAVMEQTTADHQTDGTFAGDVFGSLQSATDQISQALANIQVVDDEIAAIETSITFATGGIDQLLLDVANVDAGVSVATDAIHALSTGGGQTANLVETVDTVVDTLRVSMDFATERLHYLTTGGGPFPGGGGLTATEVANAVMNQTVADHTDAAQFAGMVQNRFSTATDHLNYLATGGGPFPGGGGLTATEVANAVMNQTVADHTDATQFAGMVQNRFSTATDHLNYLATGGGPFPGGGGLTATEVANAVMEQTTADHQTDGTFGGDVSASLQSATDQISQVLTNLQTVDDEIAAIETSITYATGGIKAELIPRLVTATGRLATLATGTQHEFAAIDASLSYATKGIQDNVIPDIAAVKASVDTATDAISALATGGGQTANLVETVDTVVDGLRASMDFATERVSYLASAGAKATALQTVDDEVAALETGLTYATDAISQIIVDVAAVKTSVDTATDSLSALATGGGAAAAPSVADILTTQMTESYAADGTAPTLAQALFLIQQELGDFAISGTTLTVKQIDGSTTAATFTLDDATSPTSKTRSG